MKTLIFTIFSLVLATLLTANIYAVSPTGGEPKANAKNVMVIGFEKDMFMSNYYGPSYLSEKTGVEADSVHRYIYSMIFNQLVSSKNITFTDIKDLNNQTAFYDNVSYSKSEDNENIDITIDDKAKLQELLSLNNSEYILFISRYQLDWSGEPFNSILHNIDYVIFNKNLDKVHSGHLFFDSEELLPFQTEKKAQRKTMLIAETVEKIVK